VENSIRSFYLNTTLEEGNLPSAPMLPPNAINPILASIAILITPLKKAIIANAAKAVTIVMDFNST
jgi:hypothetical protein